MGKENSPATADPEAKLLSFEKTRYDYCTKLFEREVSRKQTLETKAQFYLTFVTAFLTVIFLSLPFLTVLQGFMHNSLIGIGWRDAITLLLIALGIALFFSLLAVLAAMGIQNYKTGYPVPTYSSLFVPNPGNFEEGNEADLLNFTAKNFISALEDNKMNNDRKAKSVEIASYGILAAVVVLAVLVGICVYLQIYVILPTPPVTKP